MMDEIKFSSVEEQMEKLEKQGLVIKNKESARLALSFFGYSNIIKSYRDPYIITSGSEEKYRSGTTFEQIFSLYLLDKNLRNAIMSAMQDLEEHIKELAASAIASSFGTHQDEYLKYQNYRNKKKKLYRFSLTGLLDSLQKTLNTDKDPIHHYNTEHGIVPPWILFKSIYFSTMVNFIDLFKISEQDKIVHNLYSGENLGLKDANLRMLMKDTLSICLSYRNMAAHGGRIYNYKCPNTLRVNEIFEDPAVKQTTGICQLLFVLKLLNYPGPYLQLKKILNDEVDRHCNLYPNDVTYLGQILNLDIVPHSIVYVSESSNKYHLLPYCSGIKDSKPMDLEDAKSRHYVPCKRCIPKGVSIE
jgi:abortive infection bacteriophage resistance protein